jgi:asparagine synthetase B (glutamine-hydrolysing)
MYAQDTGICSQHVYAPLFQKKEVLLEKEKALEQARMVFAERVPKYFEGASTIACALTAGWDGRTVLALAPDCDITSYTYGVPGCRDLIEGRKTAQAVGIPHIGILLDDAFIKDLPWFMLETVYLSSGLERISRASLIYAYDTLTDHAGRFPLTLSGIALDMLFRGHANVPYLVSHDMAKQFRDGVPHIDRDAWASVFRNGSLLFEKHIDRKNEWLTNNFGDFNSTAHHLSYILYILSTRHFCGELAIAKHFTTVRVPSWDRKIIDLSYSIPLSTLSFSQFSDHKRGDVNEMVLQAYLMQELSHQFAGIPVGYLTPHMIMKGKLAYQLNQMFKKTCNKLAFKKKAPPLEANEEWFNVTHRDFIDALIFSRESAVREYLNDSYLNELKKERDLRQIAWVATNEIIIKLIKNQWKRYW